MTATKRQRVPKRRVQTVTATASSWMTSSGAAEGTVKGQAGHLDGLGTGNFAVATHDSFDTQPPADLGDCRIVLKPGEWSDQEVRQ